MVDKEDLHYNEDFGEFEIIQKLTSTDPIERHTAMRLVADFERMLNHEDYASMEFERLFKGCKMEYKYMTEECK